MKMWMALEVGAALRRHLTSKDMRSFLYQLARLLGDLAAIFNGTVHKRAANKWLGRRVHRRGGWR